MFKKILIPLLLSCPMVNSQVITQNFGAGANAFSIDFVQIGNLGNAADTSGNPNPAGSVSYIYNISKYEISREIVNKVNLSAGLGITLGDLTQYPRGAVPESGNGPNKPAVGLSWYEAALFVNHLNISQGYNAAYKFGAPVTGNPFGFQLWNPTDAGYQANNPFRNTLAHYFLPTTDEWYKAAYGSLSGTWFDYTTGSDTPPIAVGGGTTPGTAVYGQPSSMGPSDVDNAGGLSAFGTIGQGGNVWEWMETNADGSNDTIEEFRERQGGAWDNPIEALATTWYDSGVNPDHEHDLIGFRVASVPEPSALSLLAIGLGGLAMMRRRRS